MSCRLISVLSTLIAIVSLSLWAVENHDSHGSMNHSAASSSTLKEGGQAMFAALIEVVSMLERDNSTDWETVDVDGLRLHLLDMNRLMNNTQATKSIIGDGEINFEIQGAGDSIPSIHRMVPAHSRFLSQSRGWNIEPQLTEQGAIVTITVEDRTTLDQLHALGFYGFMSLDSHHQAHHYQMAIGNLH